MTSSVDSPGSNGHREFPDVERRMAKATLDTVRKTEDVDYREQIGKAVQRAASLVGWSLKEFAGKVNRDPRQVARWLSGQERAQLDVLWEVEELRGPLVIALAELSQQIDVETTIRVRRIA